jgi:hypothetical protein
MRFGSTAGEQESGESLDQLLAREEPDTALDIDDEQPEDIAGDEDAGMGTWSPSGRRGRLVARAGIDGGAATAQERPSRQSTTTITTSAAATDGLAERAPDLGPVLPSGPTSLPVRPVDSTDARIAVSDWNKVGSGAVYCRSVAIFTWRTRRT